EKINPDGVWGLHSGRAAIKEIEASTALPRKSLGGKLIQICLPTGLLFMPERVKIIPRENAGVVKIVKCDANRIVSDGLDLGNDNIDLAWNRNALFRRVPLHFCRR